MEEFIKKTKYKKTVGVCLIIYGFIALITPFSPASVFSIFVGAELIGIKILFWEKIKARLKRKKAHLKDSGYEKK